MSRNSAVQRHYLKNPFRYRCAHFGANREQRRRDGHYDRAQGRFIFEPGINVPAHRRLQ